MILDDMKRIVNRCRTILPLHIEYEDASGTARAYASDGDEVMTIHININAGQDVSISDMLKLLGYLNTLPMLVNYIDRQDKLVDK